MKKVMVCTVLMAGSLAVAGPASADPAGGRCPAPQSGFVVWDIDAEPYQLDNRLDEDGNNNGMVCAKPFKLDLHDDGTLFQIYTFIEDTGTGPR